MVYAISHANSFQFDHQLDTMFRDRKRVFVDRLKWNVPVVDGVYEKDQFDTEDATYIVCADAKSGAHQASLRLIPSLKPHMLRDVFSVLCEDGVPIGADIWEMTRICLSPNLARAEAREAFGHIWLGALEFGIDQGISVMTGLTHGPMFSNILAAGIDIEPLGPTRLFEGLPYAALQTRINAKVLERDRVRLKEPGRVLRYHPLTAVAA